MLFVCWLWRGRGFNRDVARYGAKHVSVLASMLKRHGGHDLICVTDAPSLIDPAIPVIPMPDAVAALPGYYPKLWAFSPEFHMIVGRQFVSIDLDVVIVGDIAPTLPPNLFALWNKAEGEPYNTSLFLLEPGFHAKVWLNFTVEAARRAEAKARRWTGDQSWVAHVLGPDQPTFGEEAGIIQYRPHHRAEKPAGMVAGFMCGPYEPFAEAALSPWVKEAYR